MKRTLNQRIPEEYYIVLSELHRVQSYFADEPLGFVHVWSVYPDPKTITGMIDGGYIAAENSESEKRLRHILEEQIDAKSKLTRMYSIILTITPKGERLYQDFKSLPHEKTVEIYERVRSKIDLNKVFYE